MAIVAPGACRDIGQPDAAAVALQIPELGSGQREPVRAARVRLCRGIGSGRALGGGDDLLRRAVDADVNGVTAPRNGGRNCTGSPSSKNRTASAVAPPHVPLSTDTTWRPSSTDYPGACSATCVRLGKAALTRRSTALRSRRCHERPPLPHRRQLPRRLPTRRTRCSRRGQGARREHGRSRRQGLVAPLIGNCPAGTCSLPGMFSSFVDLRRLVVACPKERQTSVDTIDCASWRGDVRRAATGWSDGDVVRVEGSLRRRFWRTAGHSESLRGRGDPCSTVVPGTVITRGWLRSRAACGAPDRPRLGPKGGRLAWHRPT